MANNQPDPDSGRFGKMPTGKGTKQSRNHGSSKKTVWNEKASKHPLLMAAAIASVGSVIWNVASKSRK